ncbi:ribonuclease HIII [Ktedonosporobacter rubrisoli]|uniref:ribonuclease HIII n=1 Tax=Ktedonosporobacter rubrisoli TaxID=2509675 RepID=UPI001A9245F0|nr:ribonuclease HIII [Ktedonosporobacter rubrisoli]
MQTTLAALRAYIAEKGWSIRAEKEIAYGYQLEISDGRNQNALNIYSSGKMLVQGKAGPLQNALNAWRNEQQSSAKPTATANMAAQLTFAESSPSQHIAGQAHIGSDEAGKGDYFGPLVIAAIYVDTPRIAQLQELRVRDSKLLADKATLPLAEKIKQICHGYCSIVAYPPERYNQLYSQVRNLNQLLAQAHAQALQAVQQKSKCNLALVDQFANAALLEYALGQAGCQISVEQRPKAEDDIAVAAASIVARAEFVRQLQELSLAIGFVLPKGASNPDIVSVGRKIVSQLGQEALGRVAKLHFRITEAILQSGD